VHQGQNGKLSFRCHIFGQHLVNLVKLLICRVLCRGELDRGPPPPPSHLNTTVMFLAQSVYMKYTLMCVWPYGLQNMGVAKYTQNLHPPPPPPACVKPLLIIALPCLYIMCPSCKYSCESECVLFPFRSLRISWSSCFAACLLHQWPACRT
jgi:hypothetical protein